MKIKNIQENTDHQKKLKILSQYIKEMVSPAQLKYENYNNIQV